MADLPPLLVLSDRRASERAGRPLERTVAAACEAGAPVVVLREKDLPPDERERLGEALAAVVSAHGARLVVASDWRLADRLGAWGVHLAAADPAPPADAALPAGRSCHDRCDIARAAGERLDWVTVSPVCPTGSKPGYGPALGAQGLRDLTGPRGCPPVYALGGVAPSRVAALLAAGAHGVAVMGGIMGSDDPARVTRDLLAELGR